MKRFAKHLAQLAIVVGLGFVGMGGQSARADLIPAFISVAPSGSNTKFSYSVELTHGSTITSGDYFTIYNFSGLVPPSTQPAGWALTGGTAAAPPAGSQFIAPVHVAGTDDLTWTYTGATLAAGATDMVFQPFTALSTQSGVNIPSTINYFATSSKDTGVAYNNGIIQVPAPTPEPATMTLFAFGLPFLGGYRLLRRRQA